MVAASKRTSVRNSDDHLVAVPNYQLGSADEHSSGSPFARGRSGAELATDTLLVVWLRGGFGRGAGASPAGFRDQTDRLDDVYTDAQPSGVPPPVHERSPRECSPATYGCALAGSGITQNSLP